MTLLRGEACAYLYVGNLLNAYMLVGRAVAEFRIGSDLSHSCNPSLQYGPFAI